MSNRSLLYHVMVTMICRDPNPGFGSLYYKSRNYGAWRGGETVGRFVKCYGKDVEMNECTI